MQRRNELKSSASGSDSSLSTPGLQAAIVVASILAGVAIRIPLHDLLRDKAPFSTLLPAVMFSTWAAGWRGGIVATILSVLAYGFVFIHSSLFGAMWFDPRTAVAFSILGLIISVVGQSLISATIRAEESARAARQAARLARESEARKSTILAVALDSIIVMAADGAINEFNPAAEIAFGYSRDEAIGRQLSTLIIPERMRGAHHAGLDHFLQTGDGPILGKRVEVTAMRKGGEEFPAELSVVASEHAAAMEFTAYLRDISDRKKFELDLLTSEERLRLAMEGAQIGSWHWDLATGGFVWSDTMYAITGRPRSEDPGFETFADVLHPGDYATLRNAVENSLETKAGYDVELRVAWPDGSLRWHAARGRGYYDSDGNAKRIEGIAFDITALKIAEQEAHKRAEREALINRIEQAWRSTLDTDEIQNVAVKSLGAALNVDRCYFSVFGALDDSVTIGADFAREGLPSLAGKYRLSDFEVAPADYYANDAPMVVDDVNTWVFPTPLVGAIHQLQIRSALSVPLFHQGRLVATLAVGMASTTRSWTREEIDLVETVAVHTRLAIESAQSQEREHRIATELQGALLPELPSSITGLELASYMCPALDEASIGGDFCDVFPLDKGLYAIVLGDVSGKGLAAATQLSTVRNMLRCLLYEYRDPAKAASRLNNILIANNLLIGFVTAFVGTYCAESGSIVFASCGHEPAFVRRSGSAVIESLREGGPPLGVAESASYDLFELKLNEGDLLLLYTDGLTEAGPSRQKLLGSDGLAEMFANMPAGSDLNGAFDSLVAAVAAYAQYGFRDDVCALLALRK